MQLGKRRTPMLINKKIPTVRSSKRLEHALVVIGEGPSQGQIKRIYYSHNVSSPLLNIQFSVDSMGRRNGVVSVDVNEFYKAKGWALAYDHFEAADMLDEWEEMLRYQEYLDKNKGQKNRSTFPEKLLPESILKLRSEAVDGAEKFTPSLKPKKKQA